MYHVCLQTQRYYCQNIFSADSFSGASPTLVKFSNGFLKFEVQQKHYVLSYWTPVDALPELLCDTPAEPSVVEQADAAAGSTMATATVKVIDMAGEEVPTDSTVQPAIGLALSESNTVLIQFPDPNVEALRLELDGPVGDLKTWEAQENPPPKYEDQVRRLRHFSNSKLISVHLLTLNIFFLPVYLSQTFGCHYFII